MHRPQTWAFFLLALLLVSTLGSAEAAAPRRPNVLLIMTDDQGWGDVGFHGNPLLKTPHLDRLAQQSVELTQFCVSPVCSPTRASLMTGRYNYRTGAIDTFLGRSTMVAEEVTLAELLAAAGYRTGIFGKWHLGDNYPSRAMDQGFAESLIHRGGGIGQPSDPPGNHYFDAELLHNGRPLKSQGYCSDVFTDAAIDFIAADDQRPFFAYLPFNCPHTPLEVPAEYHRQYQDKSLPDDVARLYGMIANIDDNLGRLLGKLKQLGLDENTIVVFLTDNGPQTKRFNGHWRGLKGSVYEGGIHVPCLVRWSGKLTAGNQVTQMAAHIDLAPTILEACGVETPSAVKFDGKSLWPLLQGDNVSWPDRTLFFQWHRGDRPTRYQSCAARTARFKLIQPEGRGEATAFTPAWELYDLIADPGEQHDVIDAHPDVAAELKAAYDRWFDDVGSTRGYPVPRIVVGTAHENPVTLTRQDWRGPQAGWGDKSVGYWDVDVAAKDLFDVTVRTTRLAEPASVRLKIGTFEQSQAWPAGAEQVVFRGVPLEAGVVRVEPTIERAGNVRGVHYVELSSPRIGHPAR